MSSNENPAKREALQHLTGRGGMGLVVFHLARKKIEYALTPDHSPLGDVWVSVAGRKYGIEVKTSRQGTMWQIRKSQLSRVDFYVLVSMATAQCFVLTSVEMENIVDASPGMYEGIVQVSLKQLDAQTVNAWGKIDGISGGADLTPDMMRRARGKSVLRTKTVRKTLADGTVKTYVYPGIRKR